MARKAEEIEQIIDDISWGGRYIDVGGRIFVIHPLGIKERNFLSFIYKTALNEALSAGALNKMELYSIYKGKGLWTPADDDAMEVVKADIAALEDLLSHSSGKQHKLQERQLVILKDKYAALLNRRRELFSISAESYAEEMKMLAVVFCATYDEEDERQWTKWGDFLFSCDDRLVNNIIRELNVPSEYHDTSIIREVARSAAWRFRWGGAKNIGDLFGKPICEFNSSQSALLYWSQVYDSVYESMERPPDSIIDSDEALDNWFTQQDKKRKQDKLVEGKGDIGGVKLSPQIAKHGEIFIVVNKDINPAAPTAAEVEGLNTEYVQKFKAQEAARIKAAGNIREQDLRNRHNKIARKIIGSKDAVIGRNSFGQGGKKSGKILPGGTL